MEDKLGLADMNEWRALLIKYFAEQMGHLTLSDRDREMLETIKEETHHLYERGNTSVQDRG